MSEAQDELKEKPRTPGVEGVVASPTSEVGAEGVKEAASVLTGVLPLGSGTGVRAGEVVAEPEADAVGIASLVEAVFWADTRRVSDTH